MIYDSKFVTAKRLIMTTITIPNDIPVFGVQAKSFPDGVGEAYDRLVKMIPGGFSRSYYGISFMENGKMIYYAAAEELNPGEAEKYSCERLSIKKGKYLAEELRNWRSKIHQVKDVFQRLVEDQRTDKTTPGVEWYKNEDEMLCMIKTISQ
jgi:predicted transcriptional regulator YdeE